MWFQEQQYRDHITASFLIIEVKYRQDQLVLRWGITLEFWVLFFLLPAVRFVALNTKEKTPHGI